MTRRILHSPQALADLEDIWSYIARDNPAAADRLLNRIVDVFHLIAESPDIGFEIDAVRPGIRCKPVRRNDVIFYEFAVDSVSILRVLHATMRRCYYTKWV